jgi:hypothetical protein
VEQGGFPTLYKDGQEEPNHWTTLGPWISTDASALAASRRINESNYVGIFSFHSRGAHVAMADSSVHFLSESVEPAVIEALATREGGEAIRDQDWR